MLAFLPKTLPSHLLRLVANPISLARCMRLSQALLMHQTITIRKVSTYALHLLTQTGSFNQGPFSYSFMKSSDDFTFICVAPKEVDTRVIMSFLNEVMRAFDNGGDVAVCSL